MSFYITLPSNYNGENKNNIQSDYTTLLAQQIDLNGKYEVSLVEIDYSNNIKCNMGSLTISNYSLQVFGRYAKYTNPDLEIALIYDNNLTPEAFALNLQKSLLLGCNEAIYNIKQLFFNSSITDYYREFKSNDRIVFFIHEKKLFVLDNNTDETMNLIYSQSFNGTYNVIDKRWYFDLKSKNELEVLASNNKAKTKILTSNAQEFHKYISLFNFDSISFDDKMIQVEFNKNTNIMTLKSNVVLEKLTWKGSISQHLFNKPIQSHNELDILIPKTNLDFIRYIVVYCNVIEDQFFGNVLTPILKLITIDSGKNNTMVKNTEILQYMAVKVNKLKSINISLKDLEGKPIMFADDFGFVVVKLHFRKIIE
jgi:hypothetical protein